LTDRRRLQPIIRPEPSSEFTTAQTFLGRPLREVEPREFSRAIAHGASEPVRRRRHEATERAPFDGRRLDESRADVVAIHDGWCSAANFNMFIIEFADGGLCNHHDHPFEEAYLILEGKVDIVFDGEPYVMGRGDFAWTGVGSRHAFFPKAGQRVRWLEIQAPQPPVRNGQRWHSR
jgi:mannose-6-phosphate isomerase-like protein (cupin superfamily)